MTGIGQKNPDASRPRLFSFPNHGLAMKGGSGVSAQTLNVATVICIALVYRAVQPARHRPRRHGFSLPQAARIGEFGLNSTALLQSPQIVKWAS
jgi:hypothetical protein